MTPKNKIKRVFLLDNKGQQVGELSSLKKYSKNRCVAEIRLINVPDEMLRLFRKYEEFANDQLFSHLDGIEEQLDKYGFILSSTNQSLSNVFINSDNEISFTLKKQPTKLFQRLFAHFKLSRPR